MRAHVVVGLSLAVAGCGDDGVHHLADAPPVAIDAPPAQVDAPVVPTGTIAVHVTNAARASDPAIPGMLVSFAGPDGVVVAATALDAQGMASQAAMPAGSSITVLYAGYLYITLGVQPGDTIALVMSAPDPVAIGSINLTVPLDTATSATARETSTGWQSANMGAGETTRVIPLSAGDVDATTGKLNLVAASYDQPGGVTTLRSYSLALHLDPPPAGQTLDVAMPAWKQDFDTVALSIANLPDVVTTGYLGVEPRIGSETGFDEQRIGGAPANHTIAGTGIVAKRAAAGDFDYHVDGYLGAGTSSIRFGFTSTGLVQTALNYDALIPLLRDPTIARATGAAMPTVSFATDAATLGPACAVIADATYATATGTAGFTVFAPPTTRTLALPQLPDSMAASRPAATFTGQVYDVYAVSGSVWTDADDCRQHWTRYHDLDEAATNIQSMASP